MAHLRALHDVVIVRREDKVLSKVIKIAGAERERAQFGDVIAVGPGRVGEPVTFLGQQPAIKWDREAMEHAVARDAVARVPISVAVGERVLFHPHAGSELKIGGKDYVVLCDAQILGVIEVGEKREVAEGEGAVAVPDDDEMAGAPAEESDDD